MDDIAREKQIAALRREREGYVARGNDDRVQQVDKQLAALGAGETSTARDAAATREAAGAPAPDQPREPQSPTARKRTAAQPQGKRDTSGN